MIKISVMTPDDLNFAVSMTDVEKWGYLKADFERLIYFDPEGCFIAREGDEKVGMVTTTSYNSYGFVGCLIVPKEFRGQGIGESLMKYAVGYLRAKGVGTIELDAVFPAVSMYKRLGFLDKYLSLRLLRKSGEIPRSPAPVVAKSVDDIVKFDRNKSGLDRSKMLNKYHEQMPDYIYMQKQPSLYGYAIVRPCAGNLSTIGPMVCEDRGYAERLLSSIIVKHGEKPISIGVPETNRDAVDLFMKYDFQYRPPSLRMFLGEKFNYEKHIYGIFSAEKS
jgi:ribosomal protein S18 acetylase RimI-like enzyme